MKKNFRNIRFAWVGIAFGLLAMGCTIYPHGTYDYYEDEIWEEEIVIEESSSIYVDPYVPTALTIEVAWEASAYESPELALELLTPHEKYLMYEGDYGDGCVHLGTREGAVKRKEIVECTFPYSGYYEIRVINLTHEYWDPTVTTTLVRELHAESMTSRITRETFVDPWGINVIPLYVE